MRKCRFFSVLVFEPLLLVSSASGASPMVAQRVLATESAYFLVVATVPPKATTVLIHPW
jgi:hypothetical protein